MTRNKEGDMCLRNGECNATLVKNLLSWEHSKKTPPRSTFLKKICFRFRASVGVRIAMEQRMLWMKTA